MHVIKSSKRLLPILFAAVCLIALAVPALAGEEIDPGRTGSVSVTIRAYAADYAVGGGSLNLYRVAGTRISETEEAVYYYTEDFSGCSVDLLGEDKIDLAETAETFAGWVTDREIRAETVVDVSAEGKADFGDLSLGVYLVTQNTPAEGFNSINAFLVSVPLNEDGVWIYDVDATPKASPVTKIEEPKKEEPEPSQPGTTNPDGNGGKEDGNGGITGAGGGRTGDYNRFLSGVLVIGAVLVIAVVLRRRTRRAAQ